MLKKYGLHIAVAFIVLLQLRTLVTNLKHGVSQKDTVFVPKTIKAVSNEFSRVPQQPIIIKNYVTNDNKYKELLKTLEKKYNKTADSTVILRELLQSKQPKIYKETFKDSIIKADVTAYVTDKLDSLNFKYTRLPFTYKEKIIYVSPKFRVLAGASATVSKENVILGINAGIQDSKGNLYSIGYDTNKQVTFGTKFSLFEGR